MLRLSEAGSGEFMTHNWNKTELTSINEVLQVLDELRGKRWLSRGQSNQYCSLFPSMDRDEMSDVSRLEKLRLERRAIDIFRSTVRFFSDPGEEKSLDDDIVALMVLRHYGVPSRLLDWSVNPHVSAYFATCCHGENDGAIWSFDEPQYELVGRKQWKWWPDTTTDGSGDPAKFAAGLTAFTANEPPDWFICGFYTGFHRQNAQAGAYTMTARFGRDHASAIENLFREESRYHLYIVKSKLKSDLRQILRDKHGIWRGSLFPDSAGAAETAKMITFD